MVALVAANAQCFAFCLTQTGDSATTHCHEHGKAKAGHCSLQHDLRMESAASVTPNLVVTLAEVPDLALDASQHQVVGAPALSPPVLFSAATPLPLRV
jgi:hypothetical protein